MKTYILKFSKKYNKRFSNIGTRYLLFTKHSKRIEGVAVFLAPLKQHLVQSDRVFILSFGGESQHSGGLVVVVILGLVAGHLKLHQGLRNCILISIKGDIHYKADIPPQTVQEMSLGETTLTASRH